MSEQVKHQDPEKEQASQANEPELDSEKAEQGAEQPVPDSQTEPIADDQDGGGEESQPETSKEQELEEQLKALNDRFLRTVAEYDNFRKRSQREKEAIYPQATAAAVSQFVPILDTFDRALEAPCSDEKFKKGVEMILSNFQEALKKLGVEAFGEAGDPFNPEMHNAVMHVEDGALETGVIVEVFQKGYKLGDRIIRHAMVKVAN